MEQNDKFDLETYRPISHPDPLVSIIIPTVPDHNIQTIEYLREQKFKSFEVIVIVDKENKNCLSMARNRGIREANSHIVAQTDDDCRPPDVWVKNIWEHFNNDSELVLLEGVLDKHSPSPRNYVGANLAYRRGAALDIGGFDPELSGWREDTDFGWRMEIEYGLENCCHDSNLKIHHIGPLRTSVDREKDRILRKRHPDRYFTVLDHPTSMINSKVGTVISRLYSIFPGLVEESIRYTRKSN